MASRTHFVFRTVYSRAAITCIRSRVRIPIVSYYSTAGLRRIQPIAKSNAQFRHYSDSKSNGNNQGDVQFDEIQKLVTNPNLTTDDYVLIDVRSPAEIVGGMIPTARHLPIDELDQGLQMTNTNFYKNFGFEKPSEDSNLIFYCKAGVRSKMATEIAKAKGFKNARNYPGSYAEWANKSKK
ncbi:uncharacterized protein VTP21DRAFT_5713 [Calcarisporiella thermophila]|uniref:uncharacterized protein n=1 Tax=Calcarisporiella thermophila TaxID=911321 RepID=UPI00374227DF